MKSDIDKLKWKKYLPLKYIINFKVDKNQAGDRGVVCDKYGTEGFCIERFYKEVSQIIKI